jgi:hypothetical protein
MFFEISEKHPTRIINYSYYQAQQLCSIGSGSIELLSNRLEQGLKFLAHSGMLKVSTKSFPSLCLSQWFACYLSPSACQNFDAPK